MALNYVENREGQAGQVQDIAVPAGFLKRVTAKKDAEKGRRKYY